jgi:hypothetical protein
VVVTTDSSLYWIISVWGKRIAINALKVSLQTNGFHEYWTSGFGLISCSRTAWFDSYLVDHCVQVTDRVFLIRQHLTCQVNISLISILYCQGFLKWVPAMPRHAEGGWPGGSFEILTWRIRNTVFRVYYLSYIPNYSFIQNCFEMVPTTVYEDRRIKNYVSRMINLFCATLDSLCKYSI